ncbi:molecular chaperone DnaJ [Egibacter rhizosphaerae]|uniref:Chaperone protein DnaJ n=1 Tax=Egibacter rhizosphaerae TaxID=1670831 RepID=A0A411YG43_9ACTN|nr:molecular chaperone DnaJ [Egibacter rhizosphaerae]QBI20149.1 molecular chaperone DnaJ [Egibacter rhizosphaerae]
MTQRDYVEKDYYKTLGVSKDADQSEISRVYRKLAREHHPDANPDDPDAEQRFKEISEAYSVLSDPEKRKEYDQVRNLVDSGAFRGGGPGPGGAGPFGAGGGFRGAETFDLSDLLGDLFGEGAGAGGSPFGAGGSTRSRGRARTQRGTDVETELTLSFEDAMAGVTTTLRVAGPAPCSTCHGSGSRPGTSPQVCGTCGGQGLITRDQGMFGFSEPCPSCGGSGRQITDPCSTCSGSGRETRTRDIRARIPAGVKDGARIRLKGKGAPGGGGGEPGDLYVTVHVAEHEFFDRRGDNLVVHLPVTMTEAALGTKVRVPTLDGAVTVKVPAGTQPGRTLRVRGRGAPKSGGAYGDLLVVVDVVVPRKLSRTQKKMLEEFGATEQADELRAHLDAAVAAREEAH